MIPSASVTVISLIASVKMGPAAPTASSAPRLIAQYAFVHLAAESDSAKGCLRLPGVWRQQHLVELAPEEAIGLVQG